MHIPSLADARQGLTTRPARILAALGLTSLIPVGFGAARKGNKQRFDHAESDDTASNKDNGNKNDDSESSSKDDASRDRRAEKDSAQDSGSDGGGKNRNRGDTGDSDKSDRKSDHSQSASNSNDTSDDDNRDDDNSSDGDADFAQRGRADDNPSPTPTPSSPPSTNPNVTFPTPSPDDSSNVDLTVQSNPDVIAQVSGRGGFAFARSDGVTAISGPDGAKLIRTGTDTSGTTNLTPVPTPSSDGGNNNVDFNS
ncbi:MAG: hypothetical protein U0031_04735 [Thermomicrobiales bacterium]